MENALLLLIAACSLFSSGLLDRLETSRMRWTALSQFHDDEPSPVFNVGDIRIGAWEKTGGGVGVFGSVRANSLQWQAALLDRPRASLPTMMNPKRNSSAGGAVVSSKTLDVRVDRGGG